MPNLLEGPIAVRLYQMRMSRIQQTLGLSEDRARVIVDRWKQYDREFVESASRINPLRHSFDEILRSPTSEEEKNTRLKPLLDQFLILHTQQDQSRHRFEDDIRANLSTAQQVRLILLVEDMHQELGETLREAIRERRRGRE
jgi:hypothetical protein